MRIYIYLLCCMFFSTTKLTAQSPYAILERVISVRFTNTPMKESLTTVSQTGRFEFSYNARILDLNKKITLFTNGLTVRETLFQMLGDNYTYQQSGEYLIIKKQNKPKQFISGYISDAKTGKRVSNATVYDTKTLRSTTTDENGYYNLKVKERSTVVVAQLNYKDTILQITEGPSRFVKLDLDLKTEPKNIESNPLGKGKTKLVGFFTSSLHKLNNLNVQDSIRRRFQLSLLPYFGTNHAMSGSVINDFSLNATVGYSRGSRIMEFSGIGNFTKENAIGIQGSGVFNIVKGNVKGIQMAGVFNHVNDTLRGIQLGGVWNVATTAYALNQSAGVANITWFGNVKSQFAGVMNIADTLNGVQASGVLNLTRDIKGAQLAGVFSNAKTVNGVQISGILNRAHKIKGIQIGLINYADSLSGMQIGLINYAKNGGYNVVELSANELNSINIAYKSGTRKFYTAFSVGITPKSEGNIWTHGFGIGTMFKATKWSDVNLETMYRHVNVGSYSDYLQEWLQLGLNWNIHLSNRFELTVGPTYNALFMDKSERRFVDNRAKIFPSYISRTEHVNDNSVTETWVGGSLGLRIKL
jgi:CarboxypepD_reg-like domain